MNLIGGGRWNKCFEVKDNAAMKLSIFIDQASVIVNRQLGT